MVLLVQVRQNLVELSETLEEAELKVRVDIKVFS